MHGRTRFIIVSSVTLGLFLPAVQAGAVPPPTHADQASAAAWSAVAQAPLGWESQAFSVQAVRPTVAARAVVLRPSVSPAIVGEKVTFRADLGTVGVRPVSLQVRRSNGWRVVASGKSDAKGRVVLTPRAGATTGSTTHRVVAPAARVGKRALKGVATASATVRAVPQSARLTAPVNAAVGSRVTVTVQSTPARAGRSVLLQERRVGRWGEQTWTNVGRAVQDRTGRATFAFTRTKEETVLRGLVTGGAAPAVASRSWSWPPAGALAPIDIGNTPDETVYDWGAWSSNDDVQYSTDRSGSLVVTARSKKGDTLQVDTFDRTTYRRVGTSRRISLAGWPQWGGVYVAPDGHRYVLLGRLNKAERRDVDVIEVRRYDAGWNLVGTAHLPGGASQGFEGLSGPLSYSAAHMLLVGDRLVVHSGREMFGHGGVVHQSNFTFEVNVPTMTARTFEDLGNGKWSATPYVSHSFQALVATWKSNLVLVDHGDAYPRALRMSVVRDYPNSREITAHDLMRFNGAIGDNSTGTAVTGLVSGSAGVVVVGNSVRHVGAPGGPFTPQEKRNVFAIAADPATGASRTVWLTAFSPTGREIVSHPRVVTLAADQFAVIFQVERAGTYRTEYRLLDSSAKVLGSASFAGLRFPAGSEPVRLGTRVVWAGGGSGAASGGQNYLFGLDIGEPTRPALPRG